MADLEASARDDARQVNIGGANYGSIYVSDSPTLKPNQLPPDLRDFSGRNVDIDRLSTALSQPGRGPAIVNLFGKPGVGKSALAIRVCHNMLDLFVDGSLYADMSAPDAAVDTSLGRQVLESFVYALDPKSNSLPLAFNALSSHYRSLLYDKRCVLLLDNAQRAEDVEPLLAGSGLTAILVTSRRPLAGIPGVQLEPVSLMDPETAKNLFSEVSGRKVDQIQVDPLADVVINLCGQLPLAIRIAAALLKRRAHWTLQRLVDELANEQTRLERLREAELDVRSSFMISYRGLSAMEATAFRYLGVAETTELEVDHLSALMGISQLEADRLLEGLADAQLVEATHNGYRFHDLLRLFSRDCLATEERRDQVARLQARSETIRADAFISVYSTRFGDIDSLYVAGWSQSLLADPAAMIRRTLSRAFEGDESIESLTTSDLLKGCRFSIVLGGPGSGKSTLARQIRNECAVDYLRGSTESPAVVVLSLRQLSSTKRPLSLQIVESIRSEAVDVSERTISHLLLDGRLIVIFDGLDEIQPAEQSQTLFTISAWMRDFPTARCVVTSRSIQLADCPPECEVFEITNPSTEDLSDYAGRIIAQFTQSAPTVDIENELVRSFQAMGTGNNPLLFSLAVEQFIRAGAIARDSAQLASRYFELFVRRWDRDRGIVDLLGAQPYIMIILRGLAIASFNRIDMQLTREDAWHEITGTLARCGLSKPDAERGASQALELLESPGFRAPCEPRGSPNHFPLCSSRAA